MLTPRGQPAVHPASRAAGSLRFPALAPLSSLEPSPVSFFRGPWQDAMVHF